MSALTPLLNSIGEGKGGTNTIAESQLPAHTHANTVSVTTQPNFTATAASSSISGTAAIPANTFVNNVTYTPAGVDSTNQQDVTWTVSRTFVPNTTTLAVTGTAAAQVITPSRSVNVAIGITNASIGSGGIYYQPHTVVNYIIKI